MVLWVSLQFVIVLFRDHATLLLHVKCEAGKDNFAYKYNKGLDVPLLLCICTFSSETSVSAVVQW